MPYMRIINPATGKPFNEVAPNQRIIQLRQQIMHYLKARYDAAQTTSQNESHWRMADALSPNAANSLSIRKVLRERSRYETLNSGYLKGIALTLAGDFVGTGPTLQVTDERFSEPARRIIELRFGEYARKIKLRRKLWRSRFAKFMDGEGFLFSILNRRIRHPIIYDYRVFECDQISSQQYPSDLVQSDLPQRLEIDGIRFDRQSGEPESYYLLNQHPGEGDIMPYYPVNGQWIGSENVIHWFRQDRDWQRGIPETTPTLPLWALLRRYTLAVVQNAEIAADFTVLLKSMVPAFTTPFPLQGTPGEPSDVDPSNWFDSFPIDRGLMTVLPDMYDLKQLDPAQPVTMYDTFVNALVQEASRPFLCPRNLALGNSGGYNMSSGTLDRQNYRIAITDERIDCGEQVLDRCLDIWWFEAVRNYEYWAEYPQADGSILEVPMRYSSLRYEPPDHLWRWDEVPEHSDPVKVAQAIDILHTAGHLSDTDIQEGRFNRPVEVHYKNLEKQEAWRRKNFLGEKEKVALLTHEKDPDDDDDSDQ